MTSLTPTLNALAAADLRDILNLIKEGNPPRMRALSAADLREAGLVELMSSREHYETESQLCQLDRKRRESDGLSTRLEEKQGEVDELQKKLASRTHKIFASADTLREEEERLAELQREIENLSQEKSSLEGELEKLRKLRSSMDDYVQAAESYVKLSPKGHALRLELIGQELSDKISYAKYREREKARKKIASDRLQRFHAFLQELYPPRNKDDENSEEPGEPEARFALALSLMPGDASEIIARGRFFRDRLQCFGWTEPYGLRIPALAAAIDGESQEIWHQLLEQFFAACSGGYDFNYGTITEAVLCLAFKETSAKQRFERLLGFSKALGEHGWTEGSFHTCYLGALFGSAEGTPEDLAKRFHEREVKVVKAGLEDSHESGYVAAILSCALDFDAALARFKVLYPKIKEFSGSGNTTTPEEIAAIVSLLPGESAETLPLLQEIANQLEEDGFEDPFGIAAMLLTNDISEHNIEPALWLRQRLAWLFFADLVDNDDDDDDDSDDDNLVFDENDVHINEDGEAILKS